MNTTTIISGGLVADGTGSPPREADVAITSGRIAAIGKKLKGDRILDARGAIVAPGFIDIHTHYDAQLLWDPGCTPSSWHGVTTVVIGNCGFTLVPCRAENRPKLIRMLVELEDMPASVLEAGIDWSFSSFKEYLSCIEGLRPSLNIASYVGHSAIRIDVMGDAAYERNATEEEIGRMTAIVKEAMDAGAIGFATSSAPGGRRSATGRANEREIMMLARAMATSGRGVVALVPGGPSLPHSRIYELQLEIGRPFTWTALLAMPDASHHERAAMHLANRKRGTQVYPQVSCRPQVAKTTMRTAFALRTPSMLALEGLSEAGRRQAFQDPSWRSKNAAEHKSIPFPVSWDRWVVAESPRHPEFIGVSLPKIASQRGVAPLDALFDLALEDDLATRFTVVQYNYQEDDVAALLNMDGTVLGLADSGAHPDQLCDAVLPTDLLGKWVREKRALSLEKAVRKLSGELADLYGFDRGYLRSGAPADVVVFDPDTIAPGPVRRVADQPAGGERLIADQTIGLRHVLVNGTPIRQDGEQLQRGAKGGPGYILRGA